ncbi:MAG TPA: hypothetical protein VFM61_08650 [Pseudidiomarina sp.]|nr:hypothetical protein [Pseudidiomarina sp.]
MTSRFASIVVVCGMVLLGSMLSPSWQARANNVTQQCDDLLKNTEQKQAYEECTALEKEVTWKSWFSGQSRSTQFHFLDLFELLFGSSDTKRDFTPKKVR